MPRALNPVIPLVLVFILMPGLSAQSKASFGTLSARADAARDADRLDEAVGLYKKALVLRPSWTEGWWSLATIQYDRSVYGEAAGAFQKVIALAPKNGTAYAMLGLCEFQLGRDELALQHIQRGKRIGLYKDDSLWKVVLYHEGVMQQRNGHFQAAQDALDQLCQLGVQGDEAANVLGMTLLRMKSKTPPAVGSADSDVVLRVGRAQCLAGQKKYDDARQAFEAVVNEQPNYPNIHYAYGLFLLGIYDVNGGVEQFKQAIAANPKNVLAHLRVATALYKQDSAAGIPYARKAVELAPTMGFAHYLLGLLLLDTNEYQQAIPELEIAQKTFRREAKLYFALGSAYSRAGRKQDAARARATFERLNREGAKSTIAGDEAGMRGVVQEKIDKALTPQ